ncbi:DUF3343 domain-containing protein [Candidatus Acetothermia bacterium]|nr:DUF3343 domain-containing protein [Candidatus Acetothermia bacterium]MCI2428492.1 DUF3343 domain-containing protein [Candidatus Acetothermia bacterium]
MKMERLVKAEGITAKLIPAPRHLSSDCTFALCFDRRQRILVDRILTKNKIEHAGIHPLD